jgi:hypothetical protein
MREMEVLKEKLQEEYMKADKNSPIPMAAHSKA